MSQYDPTFDLQTNEGNLDLYFMFVCVEVLWPCQQLRSCRAGLLPINTVPGQAQTYLAVNQYLASTPPVVTDNYRWVITTETTLF